MRGKWLYWEGRHVNATALAREFNINPSTFINRLNRGLSVAEAIAYQPPTLWGKLTPDEDRLYKKIRRNAGRDETLRAIGRGDLVGGKP